MNEKSPKYHLSFKKPTNITYQSKPRKSEKSHRPHANRHLDILVLLLLRRLRTVRHLSLRPLLYRALPLLFPFEDRIFPMKCGGNAIKTRNYQMAHFWFDPLAAPPFLNLSKSFIPPPTVIPDGPTGTVKTAKMRSYFSLKDDDAVAEWLRVYVLNCAALHEGSIPNSADTRCHANDGRLRYLCRGEYRLSHTANSTDRVERAAQILTISVWNKSCEEHFGCDSASWSSTPWSFLR